MRLLFVVGLLRFACGLLLCLVGQLCLAGFCCCELGLEPVDTAFCVDDLFFAREERVACATDVNLHKWIFVAVFPLDGVIGLRSALRQERKLRHIVAKYDRAVIGWVNTAFHNWPIVADVVSLVKGVKIL